MIRINGIVFYEQPLTCGECKAIIIGRNDSKGFCSWFNKRKNRYDNVPKRCANLFEKAFAIGGDLVITIKD